MSYCRTLTLILFFILGSINTYSQQYSLKGRIVNMDKDYLPYTNISLIKDNVSIKNIISDSLGNFNLRATKSSYKLRFEQFGNEIYNITIDLDKDIDMGHILVEEFTLMDELVITKKKKLIERIGNNLIFNVESAPSLIGSDALEVLKTIPEVRVSDNHINLNGKNSVQLMIDNKTVKLSNEDLYNYLKTISSDNIKNIEIIKNPSAKYDAQGNNGIIKIQLKQPKSNSSNVSLRSSFDQATHSNLYQGVGFILKKDKVSILTDFGYKEGKSTYTNNSKYYYPDEKWVNYISNIDQNKNLSTLINIGYDINNKNKISVQFIGNFIKKNTNEYNHDHSYDYIENNLIKENITSGISNITPSNTSFNLNLIRKLNDKGANFFIDVDYYNNQSTKYNNLYSKLQGYEKKTDSIFAINNSKQDINNLSIKTDFEIPIDKNTLEFGSKLSYTITNNIVSTDFYEYTINKPLYLQLDKFKYKEKTYALYLNFSRKIAKKWDINFGARLETTNTSGNAILIDEFNKERYTNIFPTAFISYQLHEKHSFSLAYGKRIDKPNFLELNPSRWYISPNSYVTGNPFLKPKYIYNYEISYLYNSDLNISFNYSRVNDNTTQLTYHDIQNNSQVFKIENYANVKYLSADITYFLKPFSWLDSTNELYVNYMILNPYVDILKNKYTGWQTYFMTYNTITLNKSNTLYNTIYYEYNFPSTNGYGKISSYSTLNIGFKYVLFENKLAIGLQFNDIFKDNFYTSSNFSSNINQEFRQYSDSQSFKLTVVYKFGDKVNNIDRRTNGNQEEILRSR